MTRECVDATEVVRRLERMRGVEPAGLAFDADGTLWSGDVGEDVYTFACKNDLIRDEAASALAEQARTHGLSDEGAPSRIAERLFAAYLGGQVAERLVCEIMTWAYAGWSLTELRGVAREAFRERDLPSRRRTILTPVFEWAASNEVSVIVISASPLAVVTEALAAAGVPASGVAAAEPLTERGRIGTGMSAPLPYGEQKLRYGKVLLAGRDWLGTFGDNAFDVEMLGAARLGVAVHPKPALLARLGELPNTVILE